MILDVCRFSGETVGSGYFLVVKCNPGHSGVLSIYQNNRLILRPMGGKRASLAMLGGKLFQVAQEPPEMSQQERVVPPIRRLGYMRMECYWDRLETWKTSNGGRLLEYVRPWVKSNCRLNIEGCERAVLCPDREDLQKALVQGLLKIGVPRPDMEVTWNRILNKLPAR